MADSEEPGGSGGRINYWDIFRKDVSEYRIPTTTQPADTIFRFVKCIVYAFLFLIVFGGAIVSRGSLQVLTDQLYIERNSSHDENYSEDAISYYLLFIISIPDGVNFLLSFTRYVFGKRTSPTCVQFIIILVKEALHFFCLATIVFKILPLLNAVEVCAYLSGIPLFPSLLHSISYRKKTFKCIDRRKCFKQFLNIVSFLLQLAAVCAVPVLKLQNKQISVFDTFLMIVCAVFISVRWFETYFKYSRESAFSRFFNYENRVKTHAASTLVSSLLRLALAIALFPTFLAPGVNDPNKVFTSTAGNTTVIQIMPISTVNSLRNASYNNTKTGEIKFTQDWLLAPFLIHFFTSLGLFYGAVISTRLCMDKVCFCIALGIGTPVYVFCIVISRVIWNDHWIRTYLISKESKDSDIYISLVIFVLVWLSQLWTCRHIWYSVTDRMAFTSKIFVLPHYCSPVADLSLLHSRKYTSSHQFLDDEYKEDDSVISKVYICATMWHENRKEMKQILTTIFRLDMDQATRSIAKSEISASTHSSSNESLFETGLSKKSVMRDYYEFEAHILFDDAMETVQKDDKHIRQPNEFVQQLMEVIPEAGIANYSIPIKLKAPETYVTPYGGRYVWTLPGENKLIVHLKDKNKIRHKKRWSQIMYLYYLIGYELVDKGLRENKEKANFATVQSIFEKFPTKLKNQAENTYIMALDGDVDFSPEALQLLIDRMKKNDKVGATCGRIKPGGSGPVVWYQRFEYAIGHWLQKSAEHVFGCVLCSPGCFSLFRAKALMDDNVMRTYASLPTEPKHYLQYDQGEDRWLCTLMLQQGYRIEYCAAAEALTFAPEDFREFFNQRRRWMPSTMANILDLLMSYKTTTRNNLNISYLYIFYQIILFLSSILGPSTVLLAMQSAVKTVFSTSTVLAYILTYGPTVIFIFICLKFKAPFQLTIAMILSAIYAMLMMAVLVGTIVNISEEGIFTPSAVFLYVLVGVFLVAGFFHPHELTDLFWGLLYFICIPAGYLLLTIYAICNLNNVSWGTRETQKAMLENQEITSKRKKKTDDELGVVSQEVIEDILKQAKSTKVKDVSCKDLLPSIFHWINNLVLLRSIESVINISKTTENMEDEQSDRKKMTGTIKRQNTRHFNKYSSVNDELWAKDEKGHINSLPKQEIAFWEELIINYLKPLDADKDKEKAVARALKEFRNKVAFAFFFVNGLWLVIMSAMTEVKKVLNLTIMIDGNAIIIEPLGLLFLVIFTVLLVVQFFGMIQHRYGTFLLILAHTNLRHRNSSPDAVYEKIKCITTSPDLDDKNKEKSRERVTPNDLDNIYENFRMSFIEQRKDMGKSIKRPAITDGDQPFNFKKTFRKKMNVKEVKKRNERNKMAGFQQEDFEHF